MGFFSKFKFKNYNNNITLAAATEFVSAPANTVVEKDDGVQYTKNAKGAWDKIGVASSGSSGFARTFSKAMGAHGYGSAAEWRATSDVVNLATHTIARGNDSAQQRYYGSQGNSWDMAQAYAFGGNADNISIWAHATQTSTEKGWDFYDAYLNGTTSNGQDKTYIGSRNSSENIQKYIHSTGVMTRNFISYTHTDLHGGWSDMDNKGYIQTRSGYVSKYWMATDTELIANVNHGNHTSHDQASSHEGDYALIQTGGNAIDDMNQYSMALDTNRHIIDSSYYTGEATMAGANNISYCIGGYSSGQGGSYGQHQYINRHDILTGAVVYTGTCSADRSSGVGAAW